MRKIKYKKVKRVQPSNYEYTGIYKDYPIEMQLFVYDNDGFKEYPNIRLNDIAEKISIPNKVKWLNIHGLSNVITIQNIGEILNIESYVVGDILNTTRRTRIEELNKMLFFSIKSILPDELEEGTIKLEQISFLLTDDTLVSFQEKRGDFFTHIRERIRTHTGIVRKKPADYLLFLMLEAVMENFFITIENTEDKIEAILLLAKTNDNLKILEEIEKLRENLNFLKRSIVPLRDALFNIKSIHKNDDFKSILASNFAFFSRLHQKSLELLDQIDYDMNTLDSASSFFFSAQNHRMNEIMKTLTIIASIFIPLTFIVGVYGMNFDNIPELHHKNGYFTVMGTMALITIGMIYYFKRKKWF